MRYPHLMHTFVVCLASAVVSTCAMAAVPGDVDGDAEINAVDVQLVINGALDIPIGQLDADINRDAEVNAVDVQLVINAALGIDISGQIPDGTDTAKASFDRASEVAEVTTTIGEMGGAIEGPVGSPIEGVMVTIPAGAFDKDVEVSLGYDTGSLTPIVGDAGDMAIVLSTPGVSEFRQPVEITFPYGENGSDSNDVMPIPYYVDDEGHLHLVTLTNIDRENATATFQTFHASLFTWIRDLLGLGDDDGEPDAYTTGFVPGEDGFQIVNTGSAVNRGGECFGMTSFALWYYVNYLSSGNLYPRFMIEIGDSGLMGQNLIATRTFISIAQQWNTYLPTVSRQQNLTDTEQYTVVRNALRNTGNPVLIYLFHDQTAGTGAHSILAYGYEADQEPATFVDVHTCDPNHPNTTSNVRYDATNNRWNNYSVYDGIIYNGDGSLNLTEPYSYILADAEQQFHSSEDAVITITSHANGEEVPDRIATLWGTIESGQVAVTELEVFVNSVQFETDVGFDGAFSIQVPIDVGENHLQFVTRGEDADGDKIPVNNNMVREDFQLIGVFDTAAILVTLTWDKNETDVDLYVIDPTGDYSCYYHMATADGGVLDVDDIDGFGPEHWSLTYSDTVRWDEDYQIRLHYYSDHDNGPTNYTVTIMMYEGSDREVATTYRGNLSANDSNNDAPTDTGADWAEIATVRPAQSAGKAPVTNQILEPQPGEILHVTAPVPLPEERVKE